MGELSRPDDAPLRFGTEVFYASLGRAFVVMCGVVPVLFGVELLNWASGNFYAASRGIGPRRLDGLDGILFGPFLHWSWEHVTNNVVPLIMLGTFVLAAGVRRFLYSTAVIMLVGGLGVWLTGDTGTVHAGASGVVFGFLGLLLTRGVVERSWWNAAVAVLMGLLYWWMAYGMLPVQEGPISWEGHLFGFIGGAAAAVIFRRRRPKRAGKRGAPDPIIPPDFRMPR